MMTVITMLTVRAKDSPNWTGLNSRMVKDLAIEKYSD